MRPGARVPPGNAGPAPPRREFPGSDGAAVWPNFFIVGAAKAGTTSLHHYLGHHPQIFMSPLKEPHFFSSFSLSRWEMRLHNVVRDEKRYLRLFEAAEEARFVGEASTSYLWDPAASERIAAVSPDARIIAVLRDPVERAFSHYLNDVREGFESRPFLDALQGELDGSSTNVWPSLYIAFGQYSRQIERYQKTFSGRLLVLFFEDLTQNSQEELRRLLLFLGVDPPYVPETQFRSQNVYARPRNELARRIFGYPPARLFARAIVPRQMRGGIRHIVWSGDKTKPMMDVRARELLCDVFAPEIPHIESLLGRQIPWRDGW